MIKHVGNYELGEVLGEGSYGKYVLDRVRTARHTQTGEQFAIKILEKRKVKQDNLIENLRHEILIMKRIRHENVVRLYEVLSSHSKIYLVLELITGGELFDRLKLEGPLDEYEARRIFQQIISAVAFCGGHNIAHRDLKLENVLLDAEGRVKISDFGLSGLFSLESQQITLMHTTCGTVNYLAPEIFSNQGYDGHNADIWSCGVILYALLTGRLPFEDDKVSKLIEKIVSATFDLPKSISHQAQELLRLLLNPDPRTRISIAKIKEHPWFAIGYIEPVGDYVQEVGELQSVSSSVETMLGEDRPRNMNGFELVNFAAGILMNQMFCSGEPETHFATKAPPPVLYTRTANSLAQIGFQLRETNTHSHREFINSSTPRPTSFAVEVFQLLPGFYLVAFSRLSGSLEIFASAFERVVEDLQDLVVRN